MSCDWTGANLMKTLRNVAAVRSSNCCCSQWSRQRKQWMQSVRAGCGDDRKFLGHLFDNTFPVVGAGLSKQPRRRIPRAVVPIEQPAPIRDEWQHDPNRLSQCAGEMND